METTLPTARPANDTSPALDPSFARWDATLRGYKAALAVHAFHLANVAECSDTTGPTREQDLRDHRRAVESVDGFRVRLVTLAREYLGTLPGHVTRDLLSKAAAVPEGVVVMNADGSYAFDDGLDGAALLRFEAVHASLALRNG